MFRRLVVAVCAILAMGVLVTAEAHRRHHRCCGQHGGGGGGGGYAGENLVIISDQDVDLSTDRFTVDVSSAKGGYKGIRVRAARGHIELSNVQVVYNDGSVHNERRTINMYQGERSRVINPTADSYFVDQVTIEHVPTSGRGRLQILGVQSGEGREMIRTGRGGGASVSGGAAGAGAAASSGTSGGAGYVPPPRGTTAPNATDRTVSGNVPVRPTVDQPSTAAPGQATEGGDVLFGAQYVGFVNDRDVIRVGNEIGKFDRIRLRVLENDIHINELKVVYANGETDSLAINAEIPKNSRTNWIDLKGDRFIKEIQMIYHSKPSFRGQARIEVFGQYAANWLSPTGEGRKYNQGWVLLGAQTAGFVGFDKDTIPVGRNEGGFRKIRVTAKDRAITLSEIKVVFSNGEEEVIPVRTKVDAGGTYGPIDLKPDRRVAIDHIDAKYRSRFFDASAKGKGTAIVEIWGQH